MNIRLLIFLLLAWELTGQGQETCAVKRNTCNVDCSEAFRNPGKIAQCKRDCYARVGCATPPPTPTPPPPARPWDVIGSTGGLDDNGFFRNPVWNWAKQGDGNLLDVCGLCPCKVGTWGFSAPDQVADFRGSATCTSDDIHENSNNFCSGGPGQAKGGSGMGYHMNWFPVEYEGFLAWNGSSSWFFDDSDYSFDIFRPDLALVTVGRGGTTAGMNTGVHLEFNSTETVNDWDGTGTWWEDFHHNFVDKGNDEATSQHINGSYTIVIGMLGLDVAHPDHHSELHPAYAMFVRTAGPGPAARSYRWAFFVRNWGNEGYCAHDDEPLSDYRQIQVRVPSHGLLASNIWVYAHGPGSLDDCLAQSAVSMAPDGLLTFALPPASQRCGFVGDLTMGSITASALASPMGTPAVVAASRAAGREDEDPVLSARIAKLNPSDREELRKQVSELMKEPRTHPTVQRIKLSHPFPHEKHVRVTGKNFKAVPDPAARTKEAKKRQVIDEFLKTHDIQ